MRHEFPLWVRLVVIAAATFVIYYAIRWSRPPQRRPLYDATSLALLRSRVELCNNPLILPGYRGRLVAEIVWIHRAVRGR